MKALGIILRFLLTWLVAQVIVALLWITVGYGDLPGDNRWEGIAITLISILVATLYWLWRRRRTNQG
jgi:membrane protein implicated in regulation of membrane protease activity